MIEYGTSDRGDSKKKWMKFRLRIKNSQKEVAMNYEGMPFHTLENPR